MKKRDALEKEESDKDRFFSLKASKLFNLESFERRSPSSQNLLLLFSY